MEIEQVDSCNKKMMRRMVGWSEQGQNAADEATAGRPIWLERRRKASRGKLTRRRPGKGWTPSHMVGRRRIGTDDKGVNNGYLNVFYAQVTNSVRQRRET